MKDQGLTKLTVVAREILHPWKLIWNPTSWRWMVQMMFLFNWVIFEFYVYFWGAYLNAKLLEFKLPRKYWKAWNSELVSKPTWSPQIRNTFLPCTRFAFWVVKYDYFWPAKIPRNQPSYSQLMIGMNKPTGWKPTCINLVRTMRSVQSAGVYTQNLQIFAIPETNIYLIIAPENWWSEDYFLFWEGFLASGLYCLLVGFLGVFNYILFLMPS